MFDLLDNSVESFHSMIGKELMKLISEGGSKKLVVGQAELLPCIAAHFTLSSSLRPIL